MSDKITLQKIFDLAWQAFIIEDQPPSLGNIACLYEDSRGNRCAVGLALPKSHNALLFKGGFEALVDAWPELFDEHIQALAKSDIADPLNKLQSRLHDKWVNLDDGGWKGNKQDRMNEYLKVTEDYNLTIPAARPASVDAT